MDPIGKIISRRKYEFLQGLNQKTDEDIQQMKAYEADLSFRSGTNTKKVMEYAQGIKKVAKTDLKRPSIGWLWKSFLLKFKELELKDFQSTPVTMENIKPLMYYFTGDIENFKNSDNVSDRSKIDLKKGLLIVGNYGNGKTVTMEVLQKLLLHSALSFRTFNANDVVAMYDACVGGSEKGHFFNRMNSGTVHFDDVKTERTASNYGKVELFKDIIETRYAKKKKTFITCNYPENAPGDLEAALNEFGERYGSRVYDRLFEMFNILEFKGKSFRGK